MSEVKVHANEIKSCRGCYARVVWLKNTYGKSTLFNVPTTERGKSWLTIDTADRHDCPKKEELKRLRIGKTAK